MTPCKDVRVCMQVSWYAYGTLGRAFNQGDIVENGLWSPIHRQTNKNAENNTIIVYANM